MFAPIAVPVQVHRAAKVHRSRSLPPIREVSENLDSPSDKRIAMQRSESGLGGDLQYQHSGSGPGSPVLQTRARNETQQSVGSTLTSSSAVVPVPVVSSAALGRRRTDSSDSNSTLPGELLLYANTTSNLGEAVAKA